MHVDLSPKEVHNTRDMWFGLVESGLTMYNIIEAALAGIIACAVAFLLYISTDTEEEYEAGLMKNCTATTEYMTIDHERGNAPVMKEICVKWK